MSNQRFLVISSVGDNSLHNEWITPERKKNFDLFLIYYGNHKRRYKDVSDIYIQREGKKYPNLFNIISDYSNLIFKYDAVWFPDDDISASAKTIKKMFKTFAKHSLYLAQPALTVDSYYSWPITIQKPQCQLRFTNFVEVMAPIFSRAALKQFWKSFGESESGWGLDIIWPSLLGNSSDKIAIIDKTPVKHTRPLGKGDAYRNLKVKPREENKVIARKYKVKLPYKTITFSQIPQK